MLVFSMQDSHFLGNPSAFAGFDPQTGGSERAFHLIHDILAFENDTSNLGWESVLRWGRVGFEGSITLKDSWMFPEAQLFHLHVLCTRGKDG